MTIYMLPPGVDVDALVTTLRERGIEPGWMVHNPITSGSEFFDFRAGLTPEQQAIVDAAVAELGGSRTAALASWNTLPDWMRVMDIATAMSQIDSQVFNGQSAAQVKTAIADAITAAPNTLAGVKTVMNTLLGQAADAIIAEREIHKLEVRLLFVIRDLLIKYTKYVIGIH